MKLLALFCFLAMCVIAPRGVSQDTKKDEIKYEMNDLEKNFGIKFKAAKLQQKTTGGDALITITLEFTKDVPDRAVTRRQVASLRNLFAGKEAVFSDSAGAKGKEVTLKCYFFDEDGVAFSKQPPGKIEGEVSGKAGDAFRVTQSVPADVLARTKKISFREEPAKK